MFDSCTLVNNPLFFFSEIIGNCVKHTTIYIDSSQCTDRLFQYNINSHSDNDQLTQY